MKPTHGATLRRITQVTQEVRRVNVKYSGTGHILHLDCGHKMWFGGAEKPDVDYILCSCHPCYREAYT